MPRSRNKTGRKVFLYLESGLQLLATHGPGRHFHRLRETTVQTEPGVCGVRSPGRPRGHHWSEGSAHTEGGAQGAPPANGPGWVPRGLRAAGAPVQIRDPPLLHGQVWGPLSGTGERGTEGPCLPSPTGRAPGLWSHSACSPGGLTGTRGLRCQQQVTGLSLGPKPGVSDLLSVPRAGEQLRRPRHWAPQAP